MINSSSLVPIEGGYLVLIDGQCSHAWIVVKAQRVVQLIVVQNQLFQGTQILDACQRLHAIETQI